MSKNFLILAVSWHHWSLVLRIVNLALIMLMSLDNNHLKDAYRLTPISTRLSSTGNDHPLRKCFLSLELRSLSTFYINEDGHILKPRDPSSHCHFRKFTARLLHDRTEKSCTASTSRCPIQAFLSFLRLCMGQRKVLIKWLEFLKPEAMRFIWVTLNICRNM